MSRPRGSLLALYFKMKPLLRTYNVLLSLTVSLGACAPFPHYDVVSPSIKGKIHRNEKPAADALVYFEHPGPNKGTCSFQSERYVRTNKEGEFEFELRKQFSFFVFADRWVQWQICIADGNLHYQGWYEKALGGYPSEVIFDCNLENKSQEKQQGDLLKTKGICTKLKYN